MTKHFNDSNQILNYLRANPAFVSGFVNGEGSFTASAIIDSKMGYPLFP